MQKETTAEESNNDSKSYSWRGVSIKRRDLLIGGSGLALLSGGITFSRQLEKSGSPGGPSGPRSDGEPFTVLEEIRDALRTSPDHLPARAEQLVAEGDPSAIFRFVRDEIVTYPARINEPGEIDHLMRWGIRGTLRGGAGTPREKAELLVDLYRRAGFEAEVLVGDVRFDRRDIQRLFWRPIDRQFTLDIDDAQVSQWQERLGGPPETTDTIEVIDEDGQESQRLGQEILQQLPEERRRKRSFRWHWRAPTPIVRVLADGEEYYTNLFALDTPFGDSDLGVDELDSAPNPSDTLPVEITLSAATASDPEEPFDLVTKIWNADELVGRQVLVQMLPGLDPFDGPRFRDVRSFIPALTVQAMDLSQEEMAALSVMGDPVTRSGDRIQVRDDGAVLRNDVMLVEPDASVSADEAAVAVTEVAELEVAVDSRRHPDISLHIHARDVDGRSVEDLPATAFKVEEDGQPVGFELQTNHVVPRILILSDDSGSMPSHYRGEAMEELVDTLRKRVLDTYSDAVISHEFTHRSFLWRDLSEAAATDVQVVIYVTDGDANDTYTEEIGEMLREGPPALLLDVVEEEPPTPELERMATLTGGAVEQASDHAAAEEVILRYLEAEIPAYELTYGAPSDELGEHIVTVHTVGKEGVEGQAVYTVSETAPDSGTSESDTLPLHLCGLYLTVAVGDREVTRTLAGYDPGRQDDQHVTQGMIDEVSGALFGSYYLSFEAAAPPLSVWLDDFLSARLSVAPLDRALQMGEQEEIEEQWKAGFAHIPPELIQIVAPLSRTITETSLTFQYGLRVSLYQERPVFGADYFVRRADLLPFTGFATAADDPDERFRLTLEKTAHLAIVEDALFETSARSLLADQRLEEYSDARSGWDRERKRTWHKLVRPYGVSNNHQLTPESGDPLAFWNVDSRTGELLGVLEDGSGGGSAEERVREQLEELDRMLSMYKFISSYLGGPAGGVAAYGEVLARLYGAAALSIATLDFSHFEEQKALILPQQVCSHLRGAYIKTVFGKQGAKLVSNYEDLLGVMGVSSPLPSCSDAIN